MRTKVRRSNLRYCHFRKQNQVEPLFPQPRLSTPRRQECTQFELKEFTSFGKFFFETYCWFETLRSDPPFSLSLSLAVSVFLKMHPPTSYLDSLPFLEKRFFSKAFLDRPIPIIHVVSHRLIRSRFPFYRLHVERMHAARSAFTLTIDLYYWKVQFAAISYGERERERKRMRPFFQRNPAGRRRNQVPRVLCLFIEIFNSRCKYVKKRDRWKMQKQDHFLNSAIKIEFSFPVDFEAYKIVRKKYEKRRVHD